MTGPGRPGKGNSNIEQLRVLQLRALLHDLVRDLGQAKAAERLGVDRKTLWRSEGAAQMTPRLVAALEGMLVGQALAAREEERSRDRALEERMAGLDGQLQEVLASVAKANEGGNVNGTLIDALRDEWAGELRRLERRVDRIESVQGGGKTPKGNSGQLSPGFRQRSEGVVTREPHDSDEEIFGAGYPLISEWRALWVGHSPRGKGLAWTAKRSRILELELQLMEEYGLTLPPETASLVGPERREQLSWRERELARVRIRRARLELVRRLRRILTLVLQSQIFSSRMGLLQAVVR